MISSLSDRQSEYQHSQAGVSPVWFLLSMFPLYISTLRISGISGILRGCICYDKTEDGTGIISQTDSDNLAENYPDKPAAADERFGTGCFSAE